MNTRYGRGWFKDSQRHSLAAKGVKTRQYSARKQILSEPMFYARKRETELPFSHITEMINHGETYDGMKRMHPKVDHEDLRIRAIKAIEMRDMDNTLSTIDKNGVDKTVLLVKSPVMKQKVLSTLNDRQKGSFIADVKKDAILNRLR